MNLRTPLIAAAAVAAAFVSTLGAVAPAAARSIDAVQVSFDDLNLASAAGRNALDGRIAYAARRLCGVFLNTELEFAQESANCQREVIAAARAQRAAALRGDLYAHLTVSRAAA